MLHARRPFQVSACSLSIGKNLRHLASARLTCMEEGIGDSVRPKNKFESQGKYTRQL